MLHLLLKYQSRAIPFFLVTFFGTRSDTKGPKVEGTLQCAINMHVCCIVGSDRKWLKHEGKHAQTMLFLMKIVKAAFVLHIAKER